MNPPSSPARCSGLHSFLGPCLALRLRVPEPFSLSLSLFALLCPGVRAASSPCSLRGVRATPSNSLSLSLSLCFALLWGFGKGQSPFPARASSPVHHFSLSLSLSLLCSGVTAASRQAVLPARAAFVQPHPTFYIYIYVSLSLSLFQSLSLSLFALLRGNSCKQSFQPARRSCNPIQHSIHIYISLSLSLSLSLSFFLLGLGGPAQPHHVFMEWLDLGPPQTEAPNYKVGSPPLSWQPLPFLSLSLSLFLSLSLTHSLTHSLSLSLLCSGVTAASRQAVLPARAAFVQPHPTFYTYIYISLSLSLSLSLAFFLSAGLRGARPTTPCVYGVAGFGAPSD